jgi:superfamily I DNA/RNA helicase
MPKSNKLATVQKLLVDVIQSTIPGRIERLRTDSYNLGFDAGHSKGKKVGKAEGNSAGFTAGHVKGFEEGGTEGYAKGQQEGYADGYTEGCEDGYKTGYEAGKDVWVIEDRRQSAATRQIDASVYGPQRFAITDELKRDMRNAVAGAVAKKIIEAPTDAQWDMILSDSPATCVIAGAGSGKSTTLILRVVFMLEYLKINRNDMTVVSFTTASCEELRESLAKVLLHWNPTELKEAEAKRLVRTFHSALYKVAQSVFPGKKFFENLRGNSNKKSTKADTSKPPITLATEDNSDETSDDEQDVDNPFSSTKLSSDQIDLINKSYRDLFEENEVFRSHVLAMLALECRRVRDEPTEQEEYKSKVLRAAANRDLNLIELVNSKLSAEHGWPDGILKGPIEAFEYKGNRYYANGVFESTGRLIFIGGFTGEDRLFDAKTSVSGPDGADEFAIYSVLAMKRKLISSGCDKDFTYVNDKAGVGRLTLEARYLNQNWEADASAPIFDIQLDGEIKSTAVAEAFYVQASFMESMGDRVSTLIGKLEPFRDQCVEYHFANALSIYWVHFTKTLNDQGFMTFNDAFLALTEGGGARSNRLAPNVLAPFLHLVIDEFQDISPQIAHWLVSFQRRLAALEAPSRNPSIMAIGDDWQSIYGWRGSAPDFFINFDTHFPTHQQLDQQALVLKMMENFRSVPPIIKDAEVLLKPIVQKTDKTSIPTKKSIAGDHGIRLVECGRIEETVLDQIAQLIEAQYEEMSRLPDAHKNKIIVMSRRNSIVDSMQKRLKKRNGMLFYTYHRSKGLQAEVAIMIDDCFYNQNHKLRNRVYSATGLFGKDYTYDRAMLDEAFRLAYVGATRGRKRTIWFVAEPQGAAKELSNQGHIVHKLDALMDHPKRSLLSVAQNRH